MNYREDLIYHVRKDIKENLNSSGYWKQSIVCKIASYGYLSMKAAWECFNMYFLETVKIDMNFFSEYYDMTFKLNKYSNDGKYSK